MNINKKFFSIMCAFTFFISNSMCVAQNAQKVGVVVISYLHLISAQKKGEMIKRVMQLFSRQEWRDMPSAIKILSVAAYKHVVDRITIQEILEENPWIAAYEKEIYEIATLSEFNQEVIEFLRLLKSKGLMLVLATNRTEDIIEYLKKMNPELFELFDYVHIGNERHGIKPIKKYYQTLRKQINKRLHITNEVPVIYFDTAKKNVESAQQADVNIHGIIFDSCEKLKSECSKLALIHEIVFG